MFFNDRYFMLKSSKLFRISRSRTMDVSVGVPYHPAKEKPPINVVGDVGGRIAIMVVSEKTFGQIF